MGLELSAGNVLFYVGWVTVEYFDEAKVEIPIDEYESTNTGQLVATKPIDNGASEGIQK